MNLDAEPNSVSLGHQMNVDAVLGSHMPVVLEPSSHVPIVATK